MHRAGEPDTETGSECTNSHAEHAASAYLASLLGVLFCIKHLQGRCTGRDSADRHIEQEEADEEWVSLQELGEPAGFWQVPVHER